MGRRKRFEIDLSQVHVDVQPLAKGMLESSTISIPTAAPEKPSALSQTIYYTGEEKQQAPKEGEDMKNLYVFVRVSRCS